MSAAMVLPDLLHSSTDQVVVLTDPRPGTVVELAPGSRLALRFRKGLGPSRWHVAGLPGHLVALRQDGHEFLVLVFGGGDSSQPLRLERRHPERDLVTQVCELLVVPVTDDGARTSRRASRRTA